MTSGSEASYVAHFKVARRWARAAVHSGAQVFREGRGAATWWLGYIAGGTPEAHAHLLGRLLKMEVTGGISFHPRLRGVPGFGRLGMGLSLHDAFLDARGGLFIGDRVIFGNEVMVLTVGHDYERGMDRRGIVGSPVVIEADVWVGSRAVILAGVTIGEGSVIGAGAVVATDIEPWSFAAGVPARVVRRL